MAWNTFWGAFDNTGPYANVVLGGSPDSTGPYGIPLTTAHNAGYGYGIQFQDNGNYGVTFTLNLVGYSVTDSQQYNPNAYYVPYGGNYDYYIIISTSNNNQSSWSEIYRNRIFSHAGGAPLAYLSGWQTVASQSQWSGFFQLPTDTTHVKIELQGAQVTLPHQNIYSIQQIIPDFKPWAIRNARQWKSFDRPSGLFQIRKSGQWVNKSIMSTGETGQVNQGTSRIRKSGQWKGQGKIGS